MLQNIVMYFVNIWNATVAFFVNAGPMAWLAIVAAIIVGAMVALYIDNLERQKEMMDSEEIGGLAQAMWEEHERETALEVDTSIVGVDCPACGKLLEEGHVCWCDGCENGCDLCLDPLMAGYMGCYHRDSEECNCDEEYRKHQMWILIK
jgi:hypothetical protein